MWIKVDPAFDGEMSWVNPEHIERCDVNASLEPPYTLRTMRSGGTCTVSDIKAMQHLQKAVGDDLPRAP